MKNIRLFVAMILAPMLLCNCGGALHNSLPGSGARQAVNIGNRLAQSFAGVVATNLTDAQIDSFIDASIQGADRVLSRKLLRLMPVGMRGDFVYIRANGTAFSNQPAILAG